MNDRINKAKNNAIEQGKRKIGNLSESWKRFKGSKIKFGLFIAGIAVLLLIFWQESAATGILVWMFAKTMHDIVFKIVPHMPLTDRQRAWRVLKMAFLVITPALIAQQLMIGYFGVLAMVFVGANNFLSDTGAYLFGKNAPKGWLSPLSPVSPNKTWGGALFGILLSFAACSGAYLLLLSQVGKHYHLVIPLISKAYLFVPPQITNRIILGINPGVLASYFFVGACVNVKGDLWGSKQKRFAGIKDSSSDLGSHGGYFDKTDGLVWCFWFWDLCFLPYSHTFIYIKQIVMSHF